MCIRRIRKRGKPSDTSDEERVKSVGHDSDAPLNDPDQDLLGRANLAKRIADGIARSGEQPSALVVSINGPWGSGKTTVLRFVEHYLECEHGDEVVLLDFDPWLVSGEEELLVAFMTSLAHAFSGQVASKGQKAAKIGGAILEYVSTALKFASAVPALAVAGSLADVSDSLKDKLQKLSESSLTEMKGRISKQLREFGKRIVVFMDDLDRLDKNELHFIMKLVKLIADFPSVTYVLAFDDTMVSRSIGEMYTKADTSKEAENAGRDYLEKIVQEPIRLPIPTETALRHIALEAIFESLDRHDKTIEKNSDALQRLVIDFDRGILPFVRTPRRAKQVGARLEWALAMMEHEINTVDLVLLEALAACQPRIHQDIMNRPSLFYGGLRATSNTVESEHTREGAKAELDSHLEVESDSGHNGGWFLLHDLFPRTEGITSNTSYGSEWDSTWERDQRVATEKYLMRYVHMTIPETDVSDMAVQNVFEGLLHSEGVQRKALLGSILTRQNAQTLVFKLRQQALTLDEPIAVALAHAVALLSDQLPPMEGLSSLWSAAEQGPILMRDLLTRIGDLPLRKKIALEVLGESPSLRFVSSVLYRIEYRPESSRSIPNLFDEQASKDLADVVVGRVRDAAAKEKPVYVQNPEDAQDLLLFWERRGPKSEARDYVTKTILADPANAMSLLHVFQPVTQSLSTGIVFKGDLSVEAFLPLSRVVDVSAMRDALERTVGTKLPGDKYEDIHGDVDDRQLAEQFAYFCEHPPKEQSDATAPPAGNG